MRNEGFLYRFNENSVKCSYCGGEGYLNPAYKAVIGNMKPVDIPCPMCCGSGWINLEEETLHGNYEE